MAPCLPAWTGRRRRRCARDHVATLSRLDRKLHCLCHRIDGTLCLRSTPCPVHHGLAQPPAEGNVVRWGQRATHRAMTRRAGAMQRAKRQYSSSIDPKLASALISSAKLLRVQTSYGRSTCKGEAAQRDGAARAYPKRARRQRRACRRLKASRWGLDKESTSCLEGNRAAM